MTIWLGAVVVGVGVALLQYSPRSVRSVAVLATAAVMRALALTLLLALVLNAAVGARPHVRPLVALDASASWLRGGDSTALTAARRRLAGLAPDTVLLFGDSARPGSARAEPSDRESRVRPVVERALASGRPLVVLTDGEIDDPEALDELPSGSSVVVVDRPATRDAALVTLDAPRAFVAGDTVEARVTVSAGSAGAGAGEVALWIGDTRLASSALEAAAPFAERAIVLRGRVPDVNGAVLLRAVATTAGDREPRNDSLAVAIEVSPAAGAVLVSTSPDFDSRELLGVLRGTLSLPTRGFYRVARGVWRRDGALGPVTEEEVKSALRDAPLVILHGDTSLFGPPRAVTRGALMLFSPPAEAQGDWYAVGAPASPVMGSLSGIAWDSLPPLDVSSGVPAGDWQAVETRRARRMERRVAISGAERPRRVVIVGASGFWRWRFRAGPTTNAFAALWGSLFDWLAVERGDARAAVPAEGVVRAGEPVRWRRGAVQDSTVVVRLTRRGAPAARDSLSLRFGAAAGVIESAPMSAGVYNVETRGGSSVLVVNASRELLPRRPRVRSGSVGSAASLADAPRLRAQGWAYALLLTALCAEWLLRRRRGMR